MRLNKFLASCGVCSRREADRLIERGDVMVNGLPGETGQSVSDEDIVLVRGERISGKKAPVVLAYHKPAGVTCSERDAHAHRLISCFTVTTYSFSCRWDPFIIASIRSPSLVIRINPVESLSSRPA